MSVEKMSGYYQLHIAMSSFCLGCNSWMHEPIPTHLLNIQILLSLHLYLCIRLFKSQLTNRWLHLPDEDEARVRRNSKTWKSIIVASPEATIFFVSFYITRTFKFTFVSNVFTWNPRPCNFLVVGQICYCQCSFLISNSPICLMYWC